MAAEVKIDNVDKLDIWNELDSDSNEVKLQKKQARSNERKRISMIAGLMFLCFSPLLVLPSYYVGNTEALEKLEKLKPFLYVLSTFGCICMTYSFDYIMSYNIKSEWEKLMMMMNNPPFLGPLFFSYSLFMGCIFLLDYYYDDDQSAFLVFELFSVFSLVLFRMSYDGLKKIFS